MCVVEEGGMYLGEGYGLVVNILQSVGAYETNFSFSVRFVLA